MFNTISVFSVALSKALSAFANHINPQQKIVVVDSNSLQVMLDNYYKHGMQEGIMMTHARLSEAASSGNPLLVTNETNNPNSNPIGFNV